MRNQRVSFNDEKGSIPGNTRSALRLILNRVAFKSLNAESVAGNFDVSHTVINKQKESTGHELIITRIFDAPRLLVWKAWTEPEHFIRWWGPKNFSSPFCGIDLRVGGRYLTSMRSPECQEFWTTGVYREIVPMERIVYTDSFADNKGNVVPASHYGMPGDDWPLEMLVTVMFEEFGGKTKMILRHSGIPSGEMREQTGTGWNESFDKLAKSL